MLKLTKNYIRYLIQENIQKDLHDEFIVLIKNNNFFNRLLKNKKYRKLLNDFSKFQRYFVKITDAKYFLYLGPEFEDSYSFKHAKFSHSMHESGGIPGSKFNEKFSTDKQLKNLIAQTVAHNRPTEIDTKNSKHKWIGIKHKENIGFDSIIKKEKVSGGIEKNILIEKIGNINALKNGYIEGTIVASKDNIQGNFTNNEYDSIKNVVIVKNPYSLRNDSIINEIDNLSANGYLFFTKQEIDVVEGDLEETDLVNLVLGEVGKTNNGITLYSLVTIFPGDFGHMTSKEKMSIAGAVFKKKSKHKTMQENKVRLNLSELKQLIRSEIRRGRLG
jgi:hypothetical protein